MTRKHIAAVAAATALTVAAFALPAVAQNAAQPPNVNDDTGTGSGKTTGRTTGTAATPPSGTANSVEPGTGSGAGTAPGQGSTSPDSQMTKQTNPGPAGRTPEEPQPNSTAVK